MLPDCSPLASIPKVIQFTVANSNPQNQSNCCSQVTKAERRMLLYNRFGSREGCFWFGSREGCFCTTGNLFLNRLTLVFESLVAPILRTLCNLRSLSSPDAAASSWMSLLLNLPRAHFSNPQPPSQLEPWPVAWPRHLSIYALWGQRGFYAV